MVKNNCPIKKESTSVKKENYIYQGIREMDTIKQTSKKERRNKRRKAYFRRTKNFLKPNFAEEISSKG